MELTDARQLAPFGHEIAREFGIEGQCGFGLYLLDKAWLEEHHAAVEFVYQVFGTDALAITYGMDAIRPPIRDYPRWRSIELGRGRTRSIGAVKPPSCKMFTPVR